MEENFEKIFEQLKEQDLNPETTRKYILRIKEMISDIKENYEEELSDEEIKEVFDSEYKEDIKTKCESADIYVALRKYYTCKKILSLYNGNNNEYKRKMNIAKRLEEKSSKEEIPLNFDYEKDSISALRGILRRKSFRINAGRSEIDLIKEEERTNLEEVRKIMINSLQKNISYLEKIGVIDEHIEKVNKSLENLDLSELKYIKRNPLTDDNVEIVPDGILLPIEDENGNKIEYLKENRVVKEEDEDIGVIDSFETENLEKLSVDDLLLLNIFWEAKAIDARLELSKAKTTVDHLGIWDEIIKGNEEKIKNLDANDIMVGLKKDLALTYLSRTGAELTDNMVEKYFNFLYGSEGNKEENKKTSKVQAIKDKKVKKEQIESKRKQMDKDLENIQDEVYSFRYKLADIMTLQCVIIEKLKDKDFKSKIKWGIIEEKEDFNNIQDKDDVVVAIENSNFRGPLIMSVPKATIQAFFEKDEIDLPVFKNELNSEYTGIMAKMYLPKSKYFEKEAKKKYKENPSSSLNASLVGKKVKKGKNIER